MPYPSVPSQATQDVPSPLATSKGATLVKKESILQQLKKQYSRDDNSSGLLNEDLLFEEEKD